MSRDIRAVLRRPYRGVVREAACLGCCPENLYILNETETRGRRRWCARADAEQSLEMNLVPDEKAVWRARVEKDGTGTLHPSVWRQVGCRSSFSFETERSAGAVDVDYLRIGISTTGRSGSSCV